MTDTTKPHPVYREPFSEAFCERMFLEMMECDLPDDWSDDDLSDDGLSDDDVCWANITHDCDCSGCAEASRRAVYGSNPFATLADLPDTA
jgi:hypothetical protein